MANSNNHTDMMKMEDHYGREMEPQLWQTQINFRSRKHRRNGGDENSDIKSASK